MAVEEFILQVTIPKDTEIDGCLIGGDHLSSGRTSLLPFISRAEIVSPVILFQLCGESSSIVHPLISTFENDFSCSGIVYVP